MKLTFDNAGMVTLAGQMNRLTSPGFLRALNGKLSEAALARLEAQFQTEQDPENRRWKRSSGGRPILDRTSRLRKGFRAANVAGGGFEVFNTVPYAHVHQQGMTIKAKNKPRLRFKVGGQWRSAKQVTIPKRQMLPEQGVRLPSGWERALEDAFNGFLKEQGF